MSAVEKIHRVGSYPVSSSFAAAFNVRETTGPLKTSPSHHYPHNESVFFYSESLARALAVDAGIPEVAVSASEVRALDKARNEPGRILFTEVLRLNGLA